MLSRIENTALMLDSVDEPMDAQAPLESEPQRGTPQRFTYSNGARPLAGFTIKRGIGRGGFGEVYFAVSDGGKEVAIKLIRHNLDVEIRGVTHCLNLKHPNLIALYDVKQDDQDNSWVVMEYATGESLEEVVRHYPQGLPLAEAIDWMQGIAAGVAYLHDHGIVHRDLKPGNIFRDDGQVKLGDYGLSKFISCSRRSGQTESIGTVHYMAPEVANGRYGKEIDIYALGIILYEVLTGHVPFEGESVGEVLMKHLTAEPSLAEVPEAYRAVIAKCLAKDPARRFESVNEMMNALPPLAATMAYRPLLRETRSAAEPAAAAPEYRVPPPVPEAAFAAAAVHVAAGDEEPIWRAIRDGWRTTRDYWDGFNMPTKIIVLSIGIAGLVNNAWILQFGPGLVILYGIYRIARSVVLQNESRRNAAAAVAPTNANAAWRATSESHSSPIPPVASRAAAPLAETTYRPAQASGDGTDWRKASRRWKKKHKRQWREQAATALVLKPFRERLADLAGSMILAAVIGAALSIVVILVRGESVEPEQYAWLSMMSIVGAWAVLIPAKIWEGFEGDAMLRRVLMLVIGLAVGGLAFVAANALMIKFPDSPLRHVFNTRNFGARFYDVNGSPLLYAYLAYFGALFGVVSWWRQADPLRRTRLSVWRTIVSVLVAWAINCVWPFPQPWGLMVAAIMSISVQLVSPYVAQRERITREPS